MRIAVVFPGGIFSAWGVADGLGATLKRMGHEVLEFPRQRFGQPQIDLDALNSCKLVLLSGLEHFVLNPGYGFFDEITVYEWQHEVKPLKAAWYHETSHREDFSYATHFDQMRRIANEHFFPGIQDAEEFDQEHHAKGHAHWLPFGADTEVFKPGETVKDIECGFVGSLYGKRQAYIQQLAPALKGIALTCGNVTVQDLPGFHPRDTVLRLAENYRRCKVFLNLPTMCDLLVTKVYEVMACGTFMMTPWLGGGYGGPNMKQFKDGEELLYFRPGAVELVAGAIRRGIKDEAVREQIAQAGMKAVHEKHRLDQRLEELIEKCGMKETQQ